MPGYVYFLVLGAMLLTAAATLLAGRRQRAREGEFNSDALGFVGGVLNALFIVTLAFYTVITWTNSDNADQQAQTEAADLVDIYWQSANIGPPNQIRALLTEYTTEVADKEWPLLGQGQADPKADDLLVALRSEIARMPTDTDSQLSVRDKAVDEIEEVVNLHRARVGSATGDDVLLKVLLFGTIVGAIAMIGYPLAMGFTAGLRHVLSMVFLAGLLAFTVYFSFELDNTYSGLIRVDPDAFRSALDEFGRIP